jgi:integrase
MPANRDKKTGKWNCQFYYTDWTGKNVKKMKRGFETKKEAQDWERHFKLEKASSLDMTFGDFYRRYEADVKPKVRENTWQSKVWVIEKKILPYFKDLVMRDITPRDVLAWQNEMRKMESKDGNSFKGTYLRKMQAELSAIFNHAVKYYELPENPAVIAGPLGQHNADEMLFWTKEEYMRFIPTMANKTYSYMAFEMLYWCGLRMGELLALTPADFDFDRNNVSITKSYQRIKGEDVITKPKTKKSVRVIKMPEMVAMEMQDFINSIYGIEPSDRIFVLSK